MSGWSPGSVCALGTASTNPGGWGHWWPRCMRMSAGEAVGARLGYCAWAAWKVTTQSTRRCWTLSHPQLCPHYLIVIGDIEIEPVKWEDEQLMVFHFAHIMIHQQFHYIRRGHTDTLSVVTLVTSLKELIPRFRSWLWHHRLPNVTTTEAQPRLWWHLGVCGVTAMTENEVSISIVSWYHKINFKSEVVVVPNCLSAVQV